MDEQARKIRQEILKEQRARITEQQAAQRAAQRQERQQRIQLRQEELLNRRLAGQKARAAQTQQILVLLQRKDLF